MFCEEESSTFCERMPVMRRRDLCVGGQRFAGLDLLEGLFCKRTHTNTGLFWPKPPDD